MTHDIETFFAAFEAALAAGTLAKLTLGAYHGKDEGLKNLVMTPVELKGEAHISVVTHYATRDVTTVVTMEEAVPVVERNLDRWAFRSAHLFTTEEDLQLRISKKGKTLLRRSAPSHTAPATTTHDRVKERPLDPAAPWVRELGLADSSGSIIPAASKKWKQINRFVELLRDALERSSLGDAETVRIVDFGSGKGYLTFAAHDYLTRHLDATVETLGVELRPALVELCNGIARQNGIEGLRFVEGDIEQVETGAIDLMIALHACDTATDLALHKGITAEASIILSAPCCHKEVRRLMTVPPVLAPMLRYGKHLDREAELLTDSIRALHLEEQGYTVRIAEFVPIEHTPKNSLIMAVRSRRADSGKVREAREKRGELEAFYRVEGQRLGELLRHHDPLP